MSIKLNRIDKYFGGITNGDKDKSEGVSLNIEELDIFTSPDYIQPETILASDTSITSGTPRRIWDFTVDNNDYLYALSDDGGGTPKADIWQLSSASANDPGNFTLWLDGAQNSRNTYVSSLIWHGIGDPITSARIYYVVGTNSLYYQGVSITNGTISGSETSVGALSGLSATSQYIPRIRTNGELFIGHGQFIANIDDDGVFSEKAFTLPNEWECVSFAPLGDELAIFARSIKTGSNFCKVFFWDMTASTGVDDEINVPMGGPQAIVNHSETLRVFCARDSKLRIYELLGKVPTKTHEISCDTTATTLGNDAYIIYPNSVYIKNNITYFGLARTIADNDSGLYALGRVRDDKPLALVLSKRYTTTNAVAAKSHTPLAAIPVGPNIYASFIEGASTRANTVVRTEENNSPTRSSNAIYESILIDAGTPEQSKDWKGFLLTAKSMPASTSIIIDARTDNSSNYDSNSSKTLDSTNDYADSGETADRFWHREWTSVVGRLLQIRLTFSSSGTSTPQLYSLGLLSEDQTLV